MEYTLDSEDLAMFYRSLQLLHSSKIDSQRKLYHLLYQSIRKYHPTGNNGYREKALDNPSSLHSDLMQPKENSVEVEIFCNTQSSIIQRDPRLKKDFIKPSLLRTRDPRVKVQSGKHLATLPGLTQFNTIKEESTLSVDYRFPSKVTNNCVTSIFSSGLKSDTVSPGISQSIGHCANREHQHYPKQFPMRGLSKCPARHNYHPNPISLKKIRAVLARGDSFPVHMTRAYINNITPDLQREKL